MVGWKVGRRTDGSGRKTRNPVSEVQQLVWHRERREMMAWHVAEAGGHGSLAAEALSLSIALSAACEASQPQR